MQNFELSVEKSRVTGIHVFKNRNVKYRKVLYVFHNKPSKTIALNFKLCRKGDLYTTKKGQIFVFRFRIFVEVESRDFDGFCTYQTYMLTFRVHTFGSVNY